MDILNEISLFLQTSVQMGTHILFAIVGGIICEKVGNMNLGIEGMMLMGAAVGFQVACATANPFLAVLSAGLAGLVGALIYAFITVTLRGNQVVTGLVLTIFGTGVAGFIGKSVSGNTVPAEVVDAFKPYDIPVLCDIPIIGKALFSQSGYVQAAIVVAILAYLYIKKTKFGLNMRAVGENPATSDAAGINVGRYKYVSTIVGSVIAGLGGLYYVMDYANGVWSNNGFGDRGWLAIALVIFAVWKPDLGILGSFLFGGLMVVHNYIPNLSFGAQELFMMTPYVVTIIVLVAVSMRRKRENLPPASLGLSYFREDR